MSTPVMEAYKKRKRTPKVYNIHTFAYPNSPISPSGPFRDNVKEFIRECAEREGYNVDGFPVWSTFLSDETKGFVFPMYIVEENVENSVNPLCNHCRISGWNHHFVSRRKYHLIIPRDNEWNKPIEDGVFDLQTHLLHGMIHCNGFGHLLAIRGIEGGSKKLPGRQIMDLWDRICTILRTRKITVEDVSKKCLMDLRLLHGVAYGRSWFGRWGYKFCHGSFGVTEHQYDLALDFLGTLEVQTIVENFSTTDQYKDLKHIIHHYKDQSETQLITLSNLLKCMLAAKSSGVPPQKNPPVLLIKAKATKLKEKRVKCQKFLSVAAADSRWPTRRLEYTANIVVDALKEKKLRGGGGLTRQEARDAARIHIGDTGLIDYVLKSMNNVFVGDYIVSRVVNPATRVLEFSIRPIERVTLKEDWQLETCNKLVSGVVPGLNVRDDVAFVYRNVLLGYPDVSGELVKMASGVVLNSKVFVKEWPFIDGNDDLLRFFITIKPSNFSYFEGVFGNKRVQIPPGELIIVPLYATVGDLKAEAQSAMRDTYCLTERVVITDIEGKEGALDEELLFGMGIESGSGISFWGHGLNMENKVAYEGGAVEWAVRCECGARDDDGERMVACDICEIWQHTKCVGIKDSEAVPRLFVCGECCATIMPQRIYEYETSNCLCLNGCGDYHVGEVPRIAYYL